MSLILYLILGYIGHNGHRIEEYHHALVEQDAILVSLFKVQCGAITVTKGERL